MPRVKGGTVTRQRRKKVIKLAKGYYGSKNTLFKVANQQVMKSLMYAFRDRRQKKRDFRKLWITRINAAARMNGLSYSRLMHG
ncbi:50S ribosomal protein L20, partial [Salmonella enterica]|nr:50S ribosomal protein L20 [Salmonella enterica]